MASQTAADTALADLVCAWVEERITGAVPPPLLLLSGAQGIGKSTAMARLARHRTWRIATLSLDDFYLPLADRKALAAAVHPLCATRGPPGTHDLDLLQSVLDELRAAAGDRRTRLPRFDKLADDRAPTTASVDGRVDAILIEGWLMGARPDPAAPRDRPVNALEAEDGDGVWRAWQEAALAEGYRRLFQSADAILHLEAPGWPAVLDWRLQQEAHLLGCAVADLPADRRAWVSRFVQCFERITRRMLAGHRMPGDAIVVDEARWPLGPIRPADTTRT